MRTLTFTRSAVITLDGTGGGIAELGPTLPGEVWQPSSAAISMTGNAPAGVATCLLYAGNGVSASTLVDSTYQVTGAASSMLSGQVLYPGQQVFAVWSGGNPGAIATLTVTGTRTVP